MENKLFNEHYPELFEAIQLSRVFPDSKTFVDCKPLFSPDKIMEDYNASKGQPDFDLEIFVLEHFVPPTTKENTFVSDQSISVKEHVESLWPLLTRKGSKEEISGSSLLPLPFPYIVPGGRFGEIYYWDSYFTMLGLAASGHISLIDNMVRNFDFMIQNWGHIPNGNRDYFLSRSQPPFFSSMVELLADNKGEEVYSEFILSIYKEYQYWKGNSIELEPGLFLQRYWDESPTPRQESYFEDVELAKDSSEKEDLFLNLRVACASGWDFSSRWFADKENLDTICAKDILPVDLNSLLSHYERLLTNYHPDEAIRKTMAKNFEVRKQAIMKYFYDPELGCFYDYNFVLKKRMKVVSGAAMFPLFFKLVDTATARMTIKTVLDKLFKVGGMMCSDQFTDEQWDAPNGWPPLQWIAYQGLKNYNFDDEAKELASRWMNLNQIVFTDTGKMMEKYNVTDLNLKAGGGEYPVQDGFGWTNGVYLALHNSENFIDLG